MKKMSKHFERLENQGIIAVQQTGRGSLLVLFEVEYRVYHLIVPFTRSVSCHS